ncbi:glycosyltransferase family 2 protein [Candidatus Latescibacterota bacterium]
MKKPTVSAYIITRNEEHNITRAIESVRWMDEVIVLDSISTDSTVEKAEKLGVKVTVSEFRGFVEQKNAAMELCTGDWIFNLDADEEVTPVLEKSIREVVYNDSSTELPDVYNVKRKTWYLGRWIKHCGWYPEYRARLSKRGKARWIGEMLHESLKGEGNEGYLSGDFLHRPYANLGDHFNTISHYSELWSKREAKIGRKSSLLDIILRPPAKFFKMYILRVGFLDRGPGLIASTMGALYTFMKYVRLYELSRIT